MRRLKKLSMRPWTSGLLAGCLAGVVLLSTTSAASAVTYRPTRTDDPAPNGCKKKRLPKGGFGPSRENDCSLREAVIASNAAGGGKIVLQPGTRYVLTRRGAGENAALTGDLDITSGPLIVKTEGGGKTNPATIDANGIDRIFDGSLTLNGVTLRDGHARTVAGDAGAGGAIRGFNLDIRNSRLIKNTADYHPSNSFLNGAGGAIFVNSGGEVKIDRTRLKGNRALGLGGAIFISQGASASLFKSTVAHNESSGSFGGGLAIDSGGRAEVNRSTISGNHASRAGSGGGIGMYAPLDGPTATLMVENSTVANNSASKDGGGIGSEDLIDSGSHATVELDHVTVARNQAFTGLDIEEGEHAGTGGGVYTARGDSVSIHNTVMARNTALTSRGSLRPPRAIPSDCSLRSFPAPFLSLGHNLIGSADGCTGFGATDLFGGKLKLGKLADNGGPTKTIALKKGSRAIGRGDPDALRVDQRGVKRGMKPDIGAYERRAKK